MSDGDKRYDAKHGLSYLPDRNEILELRSTALLRSK
jgi:hypothetical protein